MDQSDDPATNEVLQENHYYPFGMAVDGQWIGDPGRANLYRFNGIERQEDFGINIDLAVFRSYDPEIGRWMQIDPQAEKYYSLMAYNGMGNNPVLFSDPLGDTIKVSQIKESHPEMWETTLNDLQDVTGLSLSVDDSGNLTYDKPEGKLNGSKRARKMLMRAIDHEETVTIKGCDDCASAVTTMDKSAPIEKQNEFTLSEGQISEFIEGTSPDLSPKTYGFGMNFLHELGHTRVGGRMFDTADRDPYTLGANVRNMNKIRRQLGPRYVYIKNNPEVKSKLKKTFPYLTKKKDQCISYTINNEIEFLPIYFFHFQLKEGDLNIAEDILNDRDKYKQIYSFTSFKIPTLDKYTSELDSKIILTFSQPVSNYLIVEFLDAKANIGSIKMGPALQLLFIFNKDESIQKVLYATPIYN